MRMRLYLAAIVASVTLFATAAKAECELDGQTYPEGTTYGDYVCRNGEWVRQ